MSERELIACLDGEEMGRVRQNAQGRLQFTYAQSSLRRSVPRRAPQV